eukprot:CAMPEP_0181338354 /NCGR_PEP_ID=MMETSP1101-20121128/28591_1 /TAXON_ID=46948 /ORGANISM="Rhodomonas abbreviata, Strain Caron Lab Isolate" /LENGTH=199 /DNA_ID=CAMNT_0023449077 /DNA_START=148 /DNA_END=744 /DNA_ORIENTATION=-
MRSGKRGSLERTNTSLSAQLSRAGSRIAGFITGKKRSQRKNVPLPEWMSEDLISETIDLLRDRSGDDRIRILRGQNLSMQMDLPIWKLLRGKRSNSVFTGSWVATPQANVAASLVDYITVQQSKHVSENCSKEEALDKVLRAADPAGSVLLHQCFLLGLVSVGKAMIESHYNTPELMSLPYVSDLEPWVNAGVISRHEA